MAQIHELTIRNYRSLANVAMKGLQPFNVVLGPNGCGKSTLFDVFGFLSDCLTLGVRKALEPRGRLKELRSRGRTGPLEIEIRYREAELEAKRQAPLITYHLEIDEDGGQPGVAREFMQWTRGAGGKPFKFLDMTWGEGRVITGKNPEPKDDRQNVTLDDPATLAIAALGQLKENPRIASFRRFIQGWHLSYFVPEQARQVPIAGVNEHLERTGANLPNVVQFLDEHHPELLKGILARMSKRIPGLALVKPERTIDGRLVLQFKDGPFKEPFLARWVSDGTVKMLAYLILLADPSPPPLLCIEEPENGLHPRLLRVLAEEFRAYAEGGTGGSTSQVFVSSHSPLFVDALASEELWIVERGKDGFASVQRADRIQGVPEFLQEGATLGDLWFEGQFRKGNP